MAISSRWPVNMVSFGGGSNSAAMIIGMYQKGIPIDLILFADTGGEQPHTYAFKETFNAWLVAHGLPEITTVAYHTRDGKRLTLEDECLNSQSLPSIAYGWKKCSGKHKIAPQEKFCNNDARCIQVWKAGGKVTKFIGYDAGESRRIEHAIEKREDKKYNYCYPLYEWGWTREKCIEVIQAEGLPKPGKSSCFFCPSMKKHEIQALYLNNPNLYARAVAMEENAMPTLRTVKGLGRSWSWKEYIPYWLMAKELEEAQMSFDDFLDPPSGCICGAPCGCYDG